MDGVPNLRPSVVGKLNERQVLRAIQAGGPISRAALARQSGLSAPTVSKAVASLLVAGLLEEVAPPPAARGRPAPGRRLATSTAQVLGVVIDAGRCTVVAAGLDGVLRPPRFVPTPDSYPDLLDALEAGCRAEMLRPDVLTLGMGMSLPGLLDRRRGEGVLSPNVHVTDGHTPAADLSRRLGRHCVLLHECHALCLAEQQAGPARGLRDFVLVDTTTGVGLGVMSGGRLVTGHGGLAGELGHVPVVLDGGRACGCGNTGCLETVASEAAVAARVGERLGRAVTIDDVVDMARRGPVPEVAAAATALAFGVAVVVNLFNPATVFVHGRLPDADPGFLDRVRARAGAHALKPSLGACRIVRATATKPHGAVAAALAHLTRMIDPPDPAG